jgi:uncharacterized protein YbjT (DUF2867 family)
MIQGITTVFGGTGFLGRAIVRELATRGAPVRIAARRPERPAWAGAGHQIELVKADVRDEAGVVHALDGASGVVNAVSLYVESGGATFEAVHVEGAARVGRVAWEAGLRCVVLISGIGADPDSDSRFVRARALGEARIREAFPEAVLVRPSVMFGPDDAFLGTLAAVTRLPVVPLFGRGETRLQPAFVDDVARGVHQVLDGAGAGQQVFEFGGAEVHSYREIVEMVLRHFGRRRLLLPVPFAGWRAIAAAMKPLPSPPLTRDQVLLMEKDNVVRDGAGTLADLGVAPKALEEMLGKCLDGD